VCLHEVLAQMQKRPSYKRVAMLLRYEPDTGALYWRVPRSGIRYSRKAGSVSNVRGHRYRYVTIDGVKCLAHHVAWVLMTKRWPEMPITFKDRNSLNCRWLNLKPATISYIRAHDRRPEPASGHRGVSWHVLKLKWYARIGIEKQQHSLGYHKAKNDAVKARRRAAREHGFPN
jgi:hypothetical protein